MDGAKEGVAKVCSENRSTQQIEAKVQDFIVSAVGGTLICKSTSYFCCYPLYTLQTPVEEENYLDK